MSILKNGKSYQIEIFNQKLVFSDSDGKFIEINEGVLEYDIKNDSLKKHEIDLIVQDNLNTICDHLCTKCGKEEIHVLHKTKKIFIKICSVCKNIS